MAVGRQFPGSSGKSTALISYRAGATKYACLITRAGMLGLVKRFLFNRWKLTVTGEVLNLLNRENLRYAGFDGFASNGRVFGQLDRVLPILPSVGAVIEF